MFEGNSLTLKCQGRDNTLLSQVKFYKNGKFLHLSEDSQTLSMGIATVNSSGLYHCTGNMTHNRHVITGISKTVMVQVQGESPFEGRGDWVLLRGLLSRGQQAFSSTPFSGCPGSLRLHPQALRCLGSCPHARPPPPHLPRGMSGVRKGVEDTGWGKEVPRSRPTVHPP